MVKRQLTYSVVITDHFQNIFVDEHILQRLRDRWSFDSTLIKYYCLFSSYSSTHSFFLSFCLLFKYLIDLGKVEDYTCSRRAERDDNYPIVGLLLVFIPFTFHSLHYIINLPSSFSYSSLLFFFTSLPPPFLFSLPEQGGPFASRHPLESCTSVLRPPILQCI